MEKMDIKVLENNLVCYHTDRGSLAQSIKQLGKHTLPDDQNFLLYLPHCPRALYENILTANYGNRLSQPGRVILGNDLSEYIGSQPQTTEASGFIKPKKKRKGRREQGKDDHKDGVLHRLGEKSSYKI